MKIKTPKALHALIAIAIVAGAAVTATADEGRTWRWDYKTYGVDTGRFMRGGVAQLTEEDGRYWFRLRLLNSHDCWVTTERADVTMDEKTMTIIPELRMHGCERRRYVINRDGSGGRMDVFNGKEWVPSEYDRGLTALN